MFKKLALMLAFVGTGLCAVGQISPVIAEYRESQYQVDEAGNRRLVRQYEGRFLRSSDGSEMSFVQEVGKRTAAKVGTFRDVSSMAVYAFDNDQKMARVVARLKDPTQHLPRPTNAEQDKNIADRLRYEGLNVIVFKGPGDESKINRTWVDLDHDLIVKTEVQHPVAKADFEVYFVTELFDIHVGQEPDLSMMALREDFRVVDPKKLGGNPKRSKKTIFD